MDLFKIWAFIGAVFIQLIYRSRSEDICKTENLPKARIELRVSLDFTQMEKPSEPRQLKICIGDFIQKCSITSYRTISLYPGREGFIAFNTTFLGDLNPDAIIYFNHLEESVFKHGDVAFSTEITRQQKLYKTEGKSDVLMIQVSYTCLENHHGKDCKCCQKNPVVYTCNPNGQKVCKEGYVKKNQDCFRSECQPGICQNNGECIMKKNGFECKCTPGYSGELCSVTDPCDSSPCQNGARCYEKLYIHNGTIYGCECVKGYYGTQCEFTFTTTGKPLPFERTLAPEIITSTKVVLTANNQNDILKNASLTTVLVCVGIFMTLFFIFSAILCYCFKKRKKSEPQCVKDPQPEDNLPTFQRFLALDQQDSQEHHHPYLNPEFFCTLPHNSSNSCCHSGGVEEQTGLTYMHNTLPYPSAFRTPVHHSNSLRRNPYGTLPLHTVRSIANDQRLSENFGHYNYTYSVLSPDENGDCTLAPMISESTNHETKEERQKRRDSTPANNVNYMDSLPPSMALLTSEEDQLQRYSAFGQQPNLQFNVDARSRLNVPVYQVRYTPYTQSSGGETYLTTSHEFDSARTNGYSMGFVDQRLSPMGQTSPTPGKQLPITMMSSANGSVFNQEVVYPSQMDSSSPFHWRDVVRPQEFKQNEKVSNEGNEIDLHDVRKRSDTPEGNFHPIDVLENDQTVSHTRANISPLDDDAVNNGQIQQDQPYQETHESNAPRVQNHSERWQNDFSMDSFGQQSVNRDSNPLPNGQNSPHILKHLSKPTMSLAQSECLV